MQYKWQYKAPTAIEAAEANTIAAKNKLHPVLGKMLLERGITQRMEVKRFFKPQLSDLIDPFRMKDMQIAVERINQALSSNERILVYGDYDVDGCTAVALVYKFIHEHYLNIDYYIPNRYDEGYGITYKGIDYAAQTGVGLIIVLDCGIKAVEEIEYAKTLGIDFIICDHHEPDVFLPPAVAILNPKRNDNTYPYHHLSGCGVGFKLMQAYAANNGIEFNRLHSLLDLCAVSIATDIVPIMGENRILAWYGLKRLNTQPSLGLMALIEVCGLDAKELTLNDIIFKIGPRLNAAGRMQSGKDAVRLLVADDYNEAKDLAEKINLFNEQRKDIDRKTTEEAVESVKLLPHIQRLKSIVAYNKDWHKGVIGIVASRLTEYFYRPVVVLTESEGMACGSARSVSGFDVYHAVESCADLLENFGGHTYAAGMTMRIENIEAFRTRFEDYVTKHISDEQTEAILEIDGFLDFNDIDMTFFKQLHKFEPFGPDNTKPIFCTKRVYDYGTSKVVGRGQEHIKLELVDNKSHKVMNGIAFGQSSQARYIKTKRAFDICYTIEENTHKKGELQLQIVDIRPCELEG